MDKEIVKNNAELLTPIIQGASIENTEAILDIQSQKIIIPEEEVENIEAQQNGFLVYPILDDELKEVIKDRENNIVKIAKAEGNTIGYIISYDIRKWIATHPDWFSRFSPSNESKTLSQNEKILYGRHIAVDEKYMKTGVSKALLNSTLQEAVSHGYRYFVVEILKEPIENKRSINFVESMGFESIGELKDGDRIWSVYLKDLGGVA
jgi:GNAT superfamily N-acetyltransferase